MKSVLAAIVLLLAVVSGAVAQGGASQPAQPSPQAQSLNAIVLQIQQATASANANIGKLRIERWKTDSEQKRQLQQIADSLQKNIANAVPGLISDVQVSKGSALTSFKLYHNLNVLYEFLSGLADAAGSLGKREEYEPLAADAAGIDTARQNLSTYIEQTVGRLESANHLASSGTIPLPAGQGQRVVVPGKKVVVIDENDAPAKPAKTAAKRTKKKTSPAPSPTPAESTGTPH
jgi:hypothetical protein